MKCILYISWLEAGAYFLQLFYVSNKLPETYVGKRRLSSIITVLTQRDLGFHRPLTLFLSMDEWFWF